MKKSSYILNIVLLLSFMTVSFTAKAQWQKWHFGAGVGSLTYYGDLSDKFVNANLQELGYHAYIERLIAKRSGIYLRVESVNGHLLGSDRAPKGILNSRSQYFDRSLNFRTEIHDVNTSMVFYFGSIKKREKAPFLNAYVRAGIGVGYYDVYGDLKDANGNNYNYWSDGTIRSFNESAANAQNAEIVSRDYDFETNLRELAIEESSNRFKWQIPVGLGLKMRLAEAVSLVLDAQYTYSMTDYLDNVGDNKTRSDITDPNILYAGDPAGFIGDRPRNIKSTTGMNDSYLYVSAGLTFNVRDNSKPKFKTPVYYPKAFIPTKDTLESDYLTEAQVDSNLAIQANQAKQDSVLQKITAPSTLSLKMRVDSVALVKSLNHPNKYVVQYFIDTDSMQLEDAKILYQKDIIVSDTTMLPLIEDSIRYTSAQTILKEVNDSLISKYQEDTIMSAQDSIVMMIEQMKLQLDQLQQKVISSDTIKNESKIKSDSISKRSIPMDSLKQLNSKKDTISTNTSKKIEATKIKSSVNDTLKSKVNVVNVNMDSITHQENEDSITKVLVPIIDSSKGNSINKNLKDTTLTSNQLMSNDSTDKEVFMFSPANYNLKVKDTTSSNSVQVDSSALKSSTTNYNQEVEDLKKQIEALENSSKAKSDSLQNKDAEISQLKSAPKDSVQKNKIPKSDTIQAKTSIAPVKDSIKSNNKEEDLKRQIKDLENQLKSQKDSVSSKPVQVDSSALKSSQEKYNQQIDELNKKIESLENATKAKTDSIQKKDIKISSLKSAQKDTIQNIKVAEVDTKKVKNNNIASSADTIQYYERQQEDLKRQIEDLQKELNSKKEPANLRMAPVDTSSKKEVNSKNEPNNFRVTPRDTTSTKDSKSSNDLSIEEMKQKMKDLENDSKAKTDSLRKFEEERSNSLKEKVEVSNENTKSNLRTAPAPINDNSSDSLKLRIDELENQLNSAQENSRKNNDDLKVKASTENSKSNLRTAPAPVNDNSSDSLKRRIYELENQLNPSQRSPQSNARITSNNTDRSDTLKTSDSKKKFTPNVTLSPNVNLGSSKNNKKNQKESNNNSNSSGKNKKEKEGLVLGFEYDKPGFIEARRLKNQPNETLASDDTSRGIDSNSFTISPNGDTIYNNGSAALDSSNVLPTTVTTENSADSVLQEQNEMLRNQISNIQKNQDSLLTVLAKLVEKANQPVEKPEQVIVEKEVKVFQEVDSSAIIESLLKQPSTKVFFAVGKSSVTSQYKMGLDQLANQVNTYPELKIRLKGFADPTGNAAANLKLSETRANAVKTYLIQAHNLTPDRIIVLPAGQEENSSDMNYSRRVEVQLIK